MRLKELDKFFVLLQEVKGSLFSCQQRETKWIQTCWWIRLSIHLYILYTLLILYRVAGSQCLYRWVLIENYFTPLLVELTAKTSEIIWSICSMSGAAVVVNLTARSDGLFSEWFCSPAGFGPKPVHLLSADNLPRGSSDPEGQVFTVNVNIGFKSLFVLLGCRKEHFVPDGPWFSSN